MPGGVKTPAAKASRPKQDDRGHAKSHGIPAALPQHALAGWGNRCGMPWMTFPSACSRLTGGKERLIGRGPWIPGNFEGMCGGRPDNRALSEGKLAGLGQITRSGYTRTAKYISESGGSPSRGDYASEQDEESQGRTQATAVCIRSDLLCFLDYSCYLGRK
ncbi:MAG: hypothetical protein HGJ97_08300 [Desulfosporosinus sp.]|nr:hypothetical protein [Desulfosporosinus sp.]